MLLKPVWVTGQTWATVAATCLLGLLSADQIYWTRPLDWEHFNAVIYIIISVFFRSIQESLIKTIRKCIHFCQVNQLRIFKLITYFQLLIFSQEKKSYYLYLFVIIFYDTVFLSWSYAVQAWPEHHAWTELIILCRLLREILLILQ